MNRIARIQGRDAGTLPPSSQHLAPCAVFFRNCVTVAVMALAMVVVALSGPSWAAEDEEQELIETNREMDSQPRPSGGGEQRQMDSLAEQYRVSPQVAKEMRDRGQGWGEISTQLALAQELSRTRQGEFPTVVDALVRVRTLRDRGMGYGAVAGELGVKLGLVISNVKDSQETLRMSGRVSEGRS